MSVIRMPRTTSPKGAEWVANKRPNTAVPTAAATMCHLPSYLSAIVLQSKGPIGKARVMRNEALALRGRIVILRVNECWRPVSETIECCRLEETETASIMVRRGMVDEVSRQNSPWSRVSASARSVPAADGQGASLHAAQKRRSRVLHPPGIHSWRASVETPGGSGRVSKRRRSPLCPSAQATSIPECARERAAQAASPATTCKITGWLATAEGVASSRPT
jgi:hypothetical protein